MNIHDNEQPAGGKISRRKMLASIGMTGVAFAAGAAAWNPASGVSAASTVTSAVYGGSSLTSASVPIYNVKDFGAVGDGTTDDTAAIQSALNEAKLTGGYSHVVIPKGTYKTTNTLRIFSNTRLSLANGTKMLRCHDYSFLVNGLNGVNFPGYEGNGNIIIEGGVWEGNILQYPDAYNCFGLARGRNIIVRNLEVRDVVTDHGIDMNACEYVLVENCRFLGYKDDTADHSRDYPEAIQLGNHTATGFSQWGVFDGTPCRNIVIRGCYFGASGTAGTQAWPAGVGNHYAVHNLYNNNIKIYGNTFEGMTFAGVRSFKFAELFIANNLFIGCQRGIMLSNPQADTESSKDANGVQSGLPQSSRNVIITGNTFKGTLAENVYCVGWPKNNTTVAKVESVLIENNVFDQGSASSSCMTIRWTNDLTIGGNVFRNQYRGMFLSYVSNANIHDNTFVDTKTEAIFTEEPDADYKNNGHTANLNVHDNLIQRCGRTGIYMQTVDGFAVKDNVIESPATETDNTRSGILAANAAKNGVIAGNKVKKAASGNLNQYGISVTSTCSNVQVADNNVEGKTGRVSVLGTSNFDGIYMHSADGTRFKMTVGNDGVPVFTAG